MAPFSFSCRPCHVVLLLVSLLAASLPVARGAACTSALFKVAEGAFNATTPLALAQHILAQELQAPCAADNCPEVSTSQCSGQSIDDLQCYMPGIASTSVAVGPVSLPITVNLESVQNLVSSLSIQRVQLGCSGDGLGTPATFDLNLTAAWSNVSIVFDINTGGLVTSTDQISAL